ncbi:MAG: GspH/FimT family pseudopilin [Methylococcales bacterium]
MTANVLNNRGFTLIELIVTMGVAALLLTIGVPNFIELVRNHRMAAQYNDFVAALNSTRSEAIKRGTGITICKRNVAGTACNSGGNWEGGWLVFLDQDRDGVVDTGEPIVRLYEALTGSNTLRRNIATSRITYNGQGFASGLGLPPAASTFKFCDIRGASHAKGLILSNNGRARRAIDINADGIVEDGSSNNITCP